MTAKEDALRQAVQNGRTMDGTGAPKELVIIDGDWAGDEMQLAAVLLNHPDRFEVLGATAVFGNTDLDQVAANGRNILHFLNADHIDLYPGERCPRGMTEPPSGDGAHGVIDLPQSPVEPQTKQALDFMLETLENNEPGSVTIVAVGPLTNIAHALHRAPETMRRIKRLVVMGGCTADMPACDTPIRRGNITHQAEFNFQQAPQDAEDVMASGLPITLLPMNCTHQLTFTPERQEAVRKALSPGDADAVCNMMMAPAEFDRRKFDIDPVIHDVHCALYLLNPDAYITARGKVTVSTVNDTGVPFEENPQGRSDFEATDEGNVTVATGLREGAADRLFDTVLQGIAARTAAAAAPRITVVGSCVMDLVTYGARAPEDGETLLGENFEIGYGGKGANQAVAASRSGADVAMISCVGNDLFGEGTIKNFRDHGIDTSGITVIADMPTGTAPIFVSTKTGQNRILVNLGANNRISPEIALASLEKSPKPDAIIMQCEMPLETVYRTTKYARENGIISILNVAPAVPVDLESLEGLDYLVVNESEAEALAGIKVKGKDDAGYVGRKLLENSKIGRVIVTLGDKGATLVGRNEMIHTSCWPVTPVDTSGAGDAWLGCFAAFLVQGYGEEESMRRANLFAGLSTEKKGTQKSYPDLQRINAVCGNRPAPRPAPL